MPLSEEQKKQIEDIVYKQRIYVIEDIVLLACLPVKEVREHLKKHVAHEIIKCPYCGREIVKVWNNPQKKFCSEEHKRLYYNKHRKKTKTSICKCCGKEYQHYSFRNTGFCSIHCAKVYKPKTDDPETNETK